MYPISQSLRSYSFASVLIALLCLLVIMPGVLSTAQSTNSTSTLAAIRDLIYRQQYNQAISRLEQLLELDPRNGEALTYMATAHLYQDRSFTKAQEEFEEAFRAGGGATFFVTHSHEKFTTVDVVDYCRGWLHLRKSTVEFVPVEGHHGFKLNFSEVEEFKRNRLSKSTFHIKTGGKSQNFRGRSSGELEPLLIIALYKIFTQN